MSLKAKIEAVIYASEDPVTLVQLMGLLGEEAQAELDQLDAAQHRLALELVPPAGTVAVEADQAASFAETEPPEGGQDALNAEILEPPAPGDPVAEAADSQASEPPQDPAAGDAPSQAGAKQEKERVRRLRTYFRDVLDDLLNEYATADRGFEIREVAGGFRFATKPEYHDAVRGFVKSLKPPLKLSLQALETLAVVAYKQPVTAPEISEIRGVDSGGVLVSLLGRKLIATAGRKHVIGRPILYKTTKEFLLRFGLKDLAELPSIEEFEKLAGQMAEQEEIPMEDHTENAAEPPQEPELDSPGPDREETFNAREIEQSAPADNLADITGDKASVDGRLSSLPPDYDDVEDDPSAMEAGIQAAAGQPREDGE